MKLNNNQVTYFSLEEYVSRIKVDSFVLDHVQETAEQFDRYLSILAQFEAASVYYLLLDSLYNELIYTNSIEGCYFKSSDILENELFFDRFSMSHSKIHHLHNFIMEHSTSKQTEENKYRDTDVKVSGIYQGQEIIYYRPPKTEDVGKFMTDFIKVYRSNSLSFIHNPLLKCSLMHLLFVKIHPYKDGNGRTARMLHNIKFTDSINKVYNTNLKMSPLNISQNIHINKIGYCDRLNQIPFNLEDESNEAINRWFDFMLHMMDEQLYYTQNKIFQYRNLLDTLSTQEVGNVGNMEKVMHQLKSHF